MKSMVVCARPTLIEPLQRHGLINLPSSWSGPSKQILHCGDPLGGVLVVIASFAPSTPCMLATDRKCHVRPITHHNLGPTGHVDPLFDLSVRETAMGMGRGIPKP